MRVGMTQIRFRKTRGAIYFTRRDLLHDVSLRGI